VREASYVVLDTETTGLRAGRHGLTELYAARTDGHGTVQSEFHSLINPGRHIPRFITRLTGIDDEMVEDAPAAPRVIAAFDDFLKPRDVLVGHNLRFDLSFLNHERTRILGEPFPHQTLCTLLLARRLFAHDPLPSYRLGTLAERFSISTQGAHRAKADATMTIAVLQELLGRLEQKRIREIDQVLPLQRLPLNKAARTLC
jgi:DNA polymerase-3 subunit epsilon